MKIKEAVPGVARLYPSSVDVARIKGKIAYEQPNDSIHTFDGRLALDGHHEALPVAANNMVLRGCTLRNTGWILGVVVFTGAETKVMKKSSSSRSKMSRIESIVNKCIGIIFLTQLVLCIISTILEDQWSSHHGANAPYLQLTASKFVIPSWLAQLLTFFILYNNFIPISLYVTIEMVNFAQAYLVDKDVTMYDPETGAGRSCACAFVPPCWCPCAWWFFMCYVLFCLVLRCPCVWASWWSLVASLVNSCLLPASLPADTPAKARTSNLNQDLGQVQYVFSDKTGTLTRNLMEFKICSVGGVKFGCLDADMPHNGTGIASGASSRGKGSSKQSFHSPELRDVLSGRRPPSSVGVGAIEEIDDFFSCMALCHTVVPEQDEAGGPAIYQAESPDEGALVGVRGLSRLPLAPARV